MYGISDKLKTLFNKEVVENKSFEIFSEKLSKWHCHVEMIVLYLDILSNLFNDHFDFDEKNFSLDTNFKSNTDILIKKNFYKLASKLCSNIFEIIYFRVNNYYHRTRGCSRGCSSDDGAFYSATSDENYWNIRFKFFDTKSIE